MEDEQLSAAISLVTEHQLVINKVSRSSLRSNLQRLCCSERARLLISQSKLTYFSEEAINSIQGLD